MKLIILLLICTAAFGQAPKFPIGTRVVVAHASPKVNVRLTPEASGTLLGTQPNGRTGFVIGGPVTDTAGDHAVRYQIDYAIGMDGWSGQDYLEKWRVIPPTKSVVLSWIAPPSDGAASYNLYRKTSSGSYAKVGSVVGNVLTFTNVKVPRGTYQYVATTVDSSGNESMNSNSVTVTIP